MRKNLSKSPIRFETDEFYKINDIIRKLNHYKRKGANYIDFTGYSNVVKCRVLFITPDDDFIIKDDDIVD
jgi:hypothetical protein